MLSLNTKSQTSRELSRRGFTLIELLIVVAIIAVLAAIAVPNFLEARTRSLVARVHSDMRTTALALGAYQVDNNRYPLVLGTFAQSYQTRLRPLTTPVAYLTTLPTDPFERRIGTWVGVLQPNDPRNMYAYNTGSSAVGLGDSNPNALTQMDWSLTSGGPDSEIQFPYYAFSKNFIDTNQYMVFYYDPTNGTVSKGDIFRRGGNHLPPLEGGL